MKLKYPRTTAITLNLLAVLSLWYGITHMEEPYLRRGRQIQHSFHPFIDNSQAGAVEYHAGSQTWFLRYRTSGKYRGITLKCYFNKQGKLDRLNIGREDQNGEWHWSSDRQLFDKLKSLKP